MLLKTPTGLPKTPGLDSVWGASCLLLLLLLLLLYKSKIILYKLLRLYYKRKATIIHFMMLVLPWYWNWKKILGASLVAQWLRICLPVQGTRVRAVVWEDPTCRGATGPVNHNYWACASGACAPQQERPRQWEARAPQWRVAPACRN